MPVFQIQHPNGRVFEIDAAGQASALKAFDQDQAQPIEMGAPAAPENRTFKIGSPTGKNYRVTGPNAEGAVDAVKQMEAGYQGAPQVVDVPGVGEVEFPSGMSDEDMSAAIRRSYPHLDGRRGTEAASTQAFRSDGVPMGGDGATMPKARFPGIPVDDNAYLNDPNLTLDQKKGMALDRARGRAGGQSAQSGETKYGTTLNIEGRKVDVDESFLRLSPEEQSKTVDEIAASLGIRPGDGNSNRAIPPPPAGFVMENATPEQRQAIENARARLRTSEFKKSLGDNGGVDAALLGAGDGAGFSFADEGAAGMAYLYDKLWSGKGRSYDEYLDRARAVQENAQESNPISYGAGQVGGAVGAGALMGAGGLSLGARAAQGGRGLGMTALGSAIDGSLAGAASGAGAGTTMDERISGAKTGAALGGLIGGAAPFATAAVGRAISPMRTDAARRAAGDYLQREGIDLSAGQITGSKGLRYAESEIGGRAAENLAERQGEQFTAAALRRAGIDANRATPEVIDDAFERIGGQFDDLAARNTIVPDHQMASDLQSVVRDYNSMVPETARAPIVDGVARDIVQAARRGPIDGGAYQSLRSRLDRAARTSAKDPELSSVLRGMKETLDDAMERSITARNPNDAGAWREVRNQYRNMIVIERAASGAGENAALGLISPSQLRNATVSGHGRRNYARGRGDFAELARSGEAVMKPMPQSGTAPRMAVRALGAGPGVIGGLFGATHSGGDPVTTVAGMLAGAAVPKVAGALMMSRLGQGYLTNELANLSPHRQAIINALIGIGGASATGGGVSEANAKQRAIADALAGRSTPRRLLGP